MMQKNHTVGLLLFVTFLPYLGYGYCSNSSSSPPPLSSSQVNYQTNFKLGGINKSYLQSQATVDRSFTETRILQNSSIIEHFNDSDATHTSRNSSEFIIPTFSFFVMGDTPYNKREERLLYQQISDLENEGVVSSWSEPIDEEPFLVHVGDLMSIKSSCSATRYKRGSEILNSSSYRVIVIPGDNDWVDCPDTNIAMDRFHRYFIEREIGQKQKRSSFQLKRQSGRRENFSFFHYDILFLGLNVRSIVFFYCATAIIS